MPPGCASHTGRLPAQSRHAVQRITHRGCVWPDERGDIKLAVEIIDDDDLLLDLYDALVIAAKSNAMLYLSVMHKQILRTCIELMEKR